MIAQGAMAFNSRRSPTTCPYSVPQILVTLVSLLGLPLVAMVATTAQRRLG
jgi:hypothetical protein